MSMTTDRCLGRSIIACVYIGVISLGADITYAQDNSSFDVLIKGGLVYDGSGAPGVRTDVAIQGDKIVAIGDFQDATAKQLIDANGMAVAPGFINMLSWAVSSLIEDGRAQSDIRQGVTLEVFGEGKSMGPLTESMRRNQIRDQGDIKYDIPWTTLSEYLNHLADRGVSVNVASFLGATTVRIHVIGYDDRVGTKLGRFLGVVRI